ncbi:C45 family autoproteolytic acyltransferase/hydrolase [Brevibacillus sp. B_LB10_24]|uniref:C45 family autoproteolytic acyltransferase/hydolase n=1 Tax=Brevibacillus sp. B_LB10_24 TaxID=3380645 RepID=UPI0038BD4A03
MKILHLQGDAKEIGRQHGEQGKDEIIKNLEIYERLFYGFQGINWRTARERAKVHLPAIEAFDAALLEEMQGVAEGAGIDLEDVLALNARSELALAGDAPIVFPDGCTSIGTASPLTSDTIIGQNWDWKAELKESLLMVKIKREKKPDIFMVTEGGIIGKIGCNEHSLGVCLNALMTDKKTSGVPIHLGLRSILDSSSLHEAMAKVQEGQMASSANFLIGYSEGKHKGMALHVEVSPFGIGISNEDACYGVHTNHICTQDILMHVADQNLLRFRDSVIRKRRAEQMIENAIQEKSEIDEFAFQRWLGDTFNAPKSINRYINNQAPEHLQTETVFSIVMNLTSKDIYVCDGMPAHESYQKYSLP